LIVDKLSCKLINRGVDGGPKSHHPPACIANDCCLLGVAMFTARPREHIVMGTVRKGNRGTLAGGRRPRGPSPSEPQMVAQSSAGSRWRARAR
jgi:hypothetical protein